MSSVTRRFPDGSNASPSGPARPADEGRRRAARDADDAAVRDLLRDEEVARAIERDAVGAIEPTGDG